MQPQVWLQCVSRDVNRRPTPRHLEIAAPLPSPKPQRSTPLLLEFHSTITGNHLHKKENPRQVMEFLSTNFRQRSTLSVYNLYNCNVRLATFNIAFGRKAPEGPHFFFFFLLLPPRMIKLHGCSARANTVPIVGLR